MILQPTYQADLSMKRPLHHFILTALVAMTLSGCGGGKPTQKDMADAVIRNLESHGLQKVGERTVVAKGLFNNIRYDLTNLEVSGCERAEGQSGYICRYQTTVKMSVTGKDEFDAEGEAYGNAVETLLAGVRNSVENRNDRFVKEDGRWRVITE